MPRCHCLIGSFPTKGCPGSDGVSPNNLGSIEIFHDYSNSRVLRPGSMGVTIRWTRLTQNGVKSLFQPFF